MFELEVDLGKCKELGKNDPLMTTWQENGFDSAWAAPGVVYPNSESENCIKDAQRIKIKHATAGDSHKLKQAGYEITRAGRIVRRE